MSSIAQFRRVLKGQADAGAAAFTDYWTGLEIEQACRDCGHAWNRPAKVYKDTNTNGSLDMETDALVAEYRYDGS